MWRSTIDWHKPRDYVPTVDIKTKHGKVRRWSRDVIGIWITRAETGRVCFHARFCYLYRTQGKVTPKWFRRSDFFTDMGGPVEEPHFWAEQPSPEFQHMYGEAMMRGLLVD